MGQKRLHQLDMLRGLLMFLGVAIHAALAYTTEKTWLINDSDHHLFFDYFVFWVNVFRMPAFYFLSGFLFSLVALQKSSMAMLGTRIVRVGVPLVFAGLLFNIPQLLISDWLSPQYGEVKRIASTCHNIKGMYEGCWTLHLWFLVTLVYFFLAGILMIPLINFAVRIGDIFGIVNGKYSWFFILLVFSTTGYFFQTLWWRGGKELFEYLPLLWTLSFFQYFPFFLAGLIYARIFQRVEDWAVISFKRNFVLVLSWSALFYLYANGNMSRTEFFFHDMFTSMLYYIVSFQTIMLLVALFIRYVNFPSVWSSYVGDALYTVYLIHHILVFLFVFLLSFTELYPLVKFFVVFLLVSSISLAFHQTVVLRFDFLKFMLNGRRRSSSDRKPPRYR